MRSTFREVALRTGQILLALTLSACGDSEPLASSSSSRPAVQGDVAATVAPERFVEVPKSPVTEATRTTDDCNLDAVDGHGNFAGGLSRERTVVLAGWMVDARSTAVPGKIELVLEGPKTFVADGTTGSRRPDIARAKGLKVFETSGYATTVDLKAVAPGRYRVVVLGFTGTETLACDTRKTISVVE
ncbi:hypothetical protein [Dyella amyloliquefaciens]|uniref:hypothetical protein n=1 Tax=Dyella amyloliquefaciens TaxID=1770545 RepID=UPI00102E2A07|nr:hypothetical protein [Dyella amyloliquefaciens]